MAIGRIPELAFSSTATKLSTMNSESSSNTRWTMAALEHIQLSMATKNFLCEVGLPNVKSLPLEYITDGSVINGNLVVADTYGNKTFIAADSEKIMMEQCIPDSKGGASRNRKMVFVNSSIKQFHDSLQLYEQFSTDPKNQSEDIEYINKQTADFKRDLAIIDQDVIELDSGWGQILEEMSFLI